MKSLFNYIKWSLVVFSILPVSGLNALQQFSDLNIKQEEAKILSLIEENRALINTLTSTITKPTWDNFIRPQDEISNRLSLEFSPIRHLNAVKSSRELRETYNICKEKLAEFSTEVGQNVELFQLLEKFRNSSEFNTLDKTQQKIILEAIKDFKLSGVDLNSEDKKHYAQIQQELSKLSSKVEENVMDATDHSFVNVKEQERMAGLPDWVVVKAREIATAKEVESFMIPLDGATFSTVLKYADDSRLRQEMHYAYLTRASELTFAGKYDNTQNIEKILALRHEEAKLLGFNNFAELSIQKKMVNTTDEVMIFLKKLAQKVRPYAKKEILELKEFVKQKYAINELQAWDIAYYSEKLRQDKYSFSEEMVREYFQEERVISGLFSLVKRLYGIDVREVAKGEVSIWDPSVRFFEIYDKSGALRGKFYLDLYSRPNKQGGAWMGDAVDRMKHGLSIQYPVAYITCNFTAPGAGKPGLLAHYEVETLFHEFGHTLQHLLTMIDYKGASGINGVEWDAVELPSQFMENWCFEKEVILDISEHYITKEKMPEELFDKILAAKNFQAGMALARQLEFSLFDFRVHKEFAQFGKDGIVKLLKEIKNEISVTPQVEYNRFIQSFTHIFAGGYAAGYYSYLWAEVLSADAFSKFKEHGVFNAQIGQSFMENILEKGSSEETDVLFTRFMGRPYSIDPLLIDRGLMH